MKMLDDIKQQVEKEMRKFDPRLAEKKYLKITQSIKDLFLKTVVCEKQTIEAVNGNMKQGCKFYWYQLFFSQSDMG
ncbi:unnamed protein product [Paramecium sonneborni]|uniref:Uncharacterized protein n=1 Tax=Paramecium sonneborni TaxID=65129 RepID=A0A8S1M6Z7_9CILI|nr:unnamed protein product [Paramecium sonneborni]